MMPRILTRRSFAQTAGGSLLASLGYAAGARMFAGTPVRPNILYIMSDQQHWRAVGYRDRFFDTPNQDSLSRQSFVFENSFCTTPQCSPSRSSIFTGWYPSTTGVMGNIGAAGGNDLRMKTFGIHLQEAGYRTAYFGKWHLGSHPVANAGWHEEEKSNQDQQTTREAISFLRRQTDSGKPFALVASYLDPHDIYDFRREMGDISAVSAPLPKSWKETFEQKPVVQKQFMTEDQGTAIWGEERRVWEYYREFYRRKVRLYDDAVGELLNALKKGGLWDHTVIILTSDHGDMDTNHHLIFKGPFMYEHMVRIPLLIRVPSAFGGLNPRRVNDYDVVNTDLTPTVLDFAGIEPYACHGRSLRPLLTGQGRLRSRDYVIAQYYSKQKWVNPIRMIRTSEFKYNHYIRHGEELYDLTNDPEELVNLARDRAYDARKRELKRELDKWIKENKDPFYSLRPTSRGGEPFSDEAVSTMFAR